jgi:predicted DNA-binding transcriptional regulator AlpA
MSVAVKRNQEEPLPELLNLRMIRARVVPVSMRLLYQWISQGTFPPSDLRIGRVRMWRRDTVLAWVEQQAEER